VNSDLCAGPRAGQQRQVPQKGKDYEDFFIQKQQDDKLSGDKIRQNDQHAPYLLSLSVFSCQFT